MIETFTRAEFEQVLKDANLNYDSLGLTGQEFCFAVILDRQSSIRIRSSVRPDGASAKVGEDSIRAYLIGPDTQPLVAKSVTGQERWIARTSGWQARLLTTIEKLRVFRAALGNCACGAPRQALISHTARNPGRVFTKCTDKKCGAWGAWLDMDKIERQEPIFGEPPIAKAASTVQQTQALEKFNAECINETQIALVEKPMDTGLAFLADLAELPEEKEPVAVKSFTPSLYQEAIREFVLNDSRALRVEAYAGSGKTSTNAFVCRALETNRGKVKMMVFSKANQLDMQAKIPDWILATTTHSAGFADIRRVYRNVKVDERKTLNIFKDAFRFNYEVRDNYPAVAKLVSLCKNTLSEPTNENLDNLCDRYDVQANSVHDSIYDAVGEVLRRSAEQTQVVDFDDMLWFPASGKVGVEKCDLLFVDEYQDNNAAQEAYYLKTGARIVFVGDARQAIYGFRGAMIGAMDKMQKLLNAEQLPLPISYRCAKSVIALAQTIVPQIQARPDAPEGVVKDVPSLVGVQSGDMVLCRNNAPLVKPCFELIRSGVKATIKGRDIGTNLMNLVRKVEKKQVTFSFNALLSAIQDYADSESSKLELQHKEAQAASLRDQCETVMALSENCQSVGDLENKAKTIFRDDVAGVVFSTIHKAKGLESDNVYILNPELLSAQKYDTRDWQLEQLRNLSYVAITRVKQNLRFVR